MTNKVMLRIAMEQSAEDIGCHADDFLSASNVLVPFKPSTKVKKFYKMPYGCAFISYGNNVVAAASEELFAVVDEYINRFEFHGCFETPNMRWLNKQIEPLGQTVCYLSEYYLPDLNRMTALPCRYEMRLLEQDDFSELYLPEWSNALCKDRKQLDVLAIGAYDGEKLAGLAGCSADAEEMWQIGVDVLPEYRRQGIASAITSRLAIEILDRGKVPFYCSAWSNIRSVRNAIKSSFLPAWVEMSTKPITIVDEINR